MRISKEELLSFRPASNYVLVRPLKDMSQIKVGDKNIILDISYQPEAHVSVINAVVAVPRELKFSVLSHEYTEMEWECEMDLKEHDIVWVNYLAMIKGIPIECEEDIYYLIPYSQIYLAKRRVKEKGKYMEMVIMINGYILISAYKVDETNPLSLEKAKKIQQTGIVEYIGRPNRRYKIESFYDDDSIREGDLVVLKNRFNKRLENPIHADFDKEYFVTQRHRLVGILNKKFTFEVLKHNLAKVN